MRVIDFFKNHISFQFFYFVCFMKCVRWENRSYVVVSVSLIPHAFESTVIPVSHDDCLLDSSLIAAFTFTWPWDFNYSRLSASFRNRRQISSLVDVLLIWCCSTNTNSLYKCPSSRLEFFCLAIQLFAFRGSPHITWNAIAQVTQLDVNEASQRWRFVSVNVIAVWLIYLT